jgi:hypothetical protein
VDHDRWLIPHPPRIHEFDFDTSSYQRSNPDRIDWQSTRAWYTHRRPEHQYYEQPLPAKTNAEAGLPPDVSASAAFKA